jgi:hypothetical protein
MSAETNRSRFLKVMAGETPSDRMPMLEWATWWDQTVHRWESEGLPQMDGTAMKRYFDLDVDMQHWFWEIKPGAPNPPTRHGQGWINSEKDYDALLPFLYPENAFDINWAKDRALGQESGEEIVWITFSGFFWWPRVLFGIEQHLFAFYDQAELMHRINQDQVDFILKNLDALCKYVTPDFMTFGEDLSYNHGPMLSKKQFDDFLAPYYRQTVPVLKERGVQPLIDSDGDVEMLIPWFEEVGLEGILPLERMAGVDVARIRKNHPKWKMIGGFDKTVMHLGEAAIRREFERLLPVIRSGRYIPSVDHQTPPGVSLEDYRLYLRLFREYAEKAVKD